MLLEKERRKFSGLGECRLSMATNAIHKECDLSETIPHLCLIYGEEGNYWVGRWVSIRPYFFDVLFYKNSTTILSEFDKEKHREVLSGDRVKILSWKHEPDSQKKELDEEYFNGRLYGQFDISLLDLQLSEEFIPEPRLF